MPTRRDRWLTRIDLALWVLGAGFVAVAVILEVPSGGPLDDVLRVTWPEVAVPVAFLLGVAVLKIAARRRP